MAAPCHGHPPREDDFEPHPDSYEPTVPQQPSAPDTIQNNYPASQPQPGNVSPPGPRIRPVDWIEQGDDAGEIMTKLAGNRVSGSAESYAAEGCAHVGGALGEVFISIFVRLPDEAGEATGWWDIDMGDLEDRALNSVIHETFSDQRREMWVED